MVTSKKRRITLIECNNDINSMIDVAKCADLVLLLCDASFGFEMEIFEFLNICQVHGMPKIMGVLTHLDAIKNSKALQRRKKELKHRFWTEVYNGAKLFYLSGILHGEYLRNEITNLGRFISVMKYRPLTWRGAHSYLLADRMEDVTNSEQIRLNPKCDRDVILYGYVRGVPMNKENMVHIAGLGDMRINELSSIDDPCPLPSALKKRNLLEKERLLYAPMSGVGGIVYDKDAVYIELQGSHSHRENVDTEKDEMMNAFIEKKETFDTRIDNQEFKLFSDGDVIKSSEFRDDNNDENDDEPINNDDDDDSGLEEQSSDEEKDEEEEVFGGWNGGSDVEPEIENSDESSDDDEYEETDDKNKNDLISNNMSWKEGLAQRARDAYLDRQATSQNLMKLVYGVFNTKKVDETNSEENIEEQDDDMVGGLFKKVAEKQSHLQKEKTTKDLDESCFFEKYGGEIRDWISDDNKDLIKNCFVTGKWKPSEDAQELLRLDDLSDAESEVYGDFEDMETGEKHDGKKEDKKEGEPAEEEEENRNKRKFSRVEEQNLTKTELMAKKMKLKAKFDSEYDNPDDGRITGDHQYYDSLKAEALKQSELNKSEFSQLDENLRVQIEGFRAGLYVRIGFKDIPCEFINHFDPSCPMLIGGLNMAEENIGYVTCKVKKHRWYKKILKSSDPVIISMGWRRFQSMPMFSKVEDNLKHRFLKYTPNHVTCSMTFWGPITPQNTGFLAIQSVPKDTTKRIGFRIAATGCVTEMDKSTQIMKKLKLVGTPFKIYKKTAFVKGMFNSTLEVAKFEGAKIKTVSGIRGQIKKPSTNPEGSFRATFEDKIMISDIVFCRTWFKVEIARFYAAVTTLLMPPGQKTEWQGMKTLGQLKRERNIKYDANIDSIYKEIKRDPKVFRPLVIPKGLQKSLPYKDKPKSAPLNPKKPFDTGRIAVIRSPHEQKVNFLKFFSLDFFFFNF